MNFYHSTATTHSSAGGTSADGIHKRRRHTQADDEMRQTRYANDPRSLLPMYWVSFDTYADRKGNGPDCRLPTEHAHWSCTHSPSASNDNHKQ
jgi:hypothetical protein